MWPTNSSPDNISAGNHTETYWAVESDRKAADHFVALGATPVQDVTNGGGSIRRAIITDPFGNHIGFIESA